jgi:hypothetical protein
MASILVHNFTADVWLSKIVDWSNLLVEVDNFVSLIDNNTVLEGVEPLVEDQKCPAVPPILHELQPSFAKLETRGKIDDQQLTEGVEAKNYEAVIPTELHIPSDEAVSIN